MYKGRRTIYLRLVYTVGEKAMLGYIIKNISVNGIHSKKVNW